MGAAYWVVLRAGPGRPEIRLSDPVRARTRRPLRLLFVEKKGYFIFTLRMTSGGNSGLHWHLPALNSYPSLNGRGVHFLNT